jgi:hypothetical protein
MKDFVKFKDPKSAKHLISGGEGRLTNLPTAAEIAFLIEIGSSKYCDKRGFARDVPLTNVETTQEQDICEIEDKWWQCNLHK